MNKKHLIIIILIILIIGLIIFSQSDLYYDLAINEAWFPFNENHELKY